MEEAKVTFYKIEKCGLYEYGSDDPKFGGLADFLNQLKSWVKKNDKPLSETCTYAIEESEDVDRTFCYDLVTNSATGDFLLTTWNETPSYEGKVAAVQAKSKVGSAKVEFTKLPKDSIPGYATYFWFIPSKNVFATIRFQHRLNGKKNLDKYFKEFISKFSDYVVLAENGKADFNVVGYSEKDGEDPINLHSQFKTVIVRKPGQIDYILEQKDHIRKITRHNRLSPKLAECQELWQKALKNLGLKKQRSLNSDVNFSYEFSFTPSETELKEMIAEWEKSHDSKWDDIGFTLKGEQGPLWLSNSLARDKFDLDVNRIDEEIVDAKSILEQLTEKRNLILGLLK
ncbi:MULTISPECIES: hypothetical protein [Gammaproteobacteria]|uniref:hypothetical protein n=1 Tax=Gammaproteobacteria TaxID=1236 RepID=UPI000C7F4D1F|nr:MULTISPECIES: hypothetical protein [Gammaproteobacteria]AXH62808.1 hypothetical protein CYG50_12645 [Providencia huaxiensis]KAB7722717.1 hypothetical protein GBN11_00840 [Proteus mirabilis]NOF30848.1 hypothetical protein [Vibrio cholerae]